MTAAHQCDARVGVAEGGHRCQRAGKHRHEIAGTTLHLCWQHLHVLTRAQREGGPESLVARWTAA